jgi:hypothetical protein
MAYSFNDPYRSLRFALRANATVVGLGLGTLLLTIPDRSMAMWGLFIEQSAWPARLGGAALVGLGINTLFVAGEETVKLGPISSVMLSNGLLVAVFLLSYIQGDLTGLTRLGQIFLILVFTLCLSNLLVPIRYFREDLIY